MSLQSIFRQILTTSANILEKLPVPPSLHSQTAFSEDFCPPLCLSEPLVLFRSHLPKSGLLPQICDLTFKTAEELSECYQKSYRSVCRDLRFLPRKQGEGPPEEIMANLRQTYETMFEKKDLPRILDDALKIQSSRCNTSFTLSKERGAFKHEYTPLLEKYFAYNAYPSAPDRRSLARKTSMSPRQIEVWFQNHRNRAKKDGKPLNRLPPNMFCNIPVELIVEDIQNFRPGECEDVISETQAIDVFSSGNLCKLPMSQAKNTFPFSTLPPPHAFPTKYPHNCADDPFPTLNGTFKFATPLWTRRPSTTKPILVSMNIDDLCQIFNSKLVLRDSKHKTQTAKLPHKQWFSATHVIPFTAPLPSFIRSSPSLKTTASTRSERHSRSWEVKPLPKRSPSNLPTSATRKSSPLSSNSRVSSLSSVASSSRSSSFSSISTSGPITPPLPSISLPQPLTFTEVDLQGLDDFLLAESNRLSGQNLPQLFDFNSAKQNFFGFDFDFSPLAPLLTFNHIQSQS